jgi:23S rRNA (pseudouridine1915-N3)-methyltransferase
MKITLCWVGKTKDTHIQEGIKKYLTFLKSYASVEIVEIKEEKGTLPVEEIKTREGQRILRQINDFILLDETGHEYTSREFAGFLKSFDSGTVRFVIGGCYGTSDAVHKKAKAMLSLSRLTLTHELSRLILLEQLYRAFTIIHNKKYHY